MPKGPTPKIDLTKKNLEEFKDADHGADDKLRQCQSLFMGHNKLTKLPITFSQKFMFLKVLYLDHNNFAEIPLEIFKLVNLSKLHLEGNQISKLPPEIGNLVNLKKLYLQENELTQLPDEIGRCTQLEKLHVHDNRLRIFTPFVAMSNSIKEISLHNNPIESPPPFVYNRGITFLLRYMRTILDSLHCGCPMDEFIYQRKINFNRTQEGKEKLKRAQTVKSLSKAQSSKSIDKDNSKVASTVNKLGVKAFEREVTEDALTIDQNHLLYFLVDFAIFAEQGRRDYMEDRAIGIPRLKQKRPTGLLDDVLNIFSKASFFAVYDGHGGVRAADYLLEMLHHNICSSEAFAKGDFEKAMRDGFQRTDADFLQQCRQYGFVDGTTCLVTIIIDNKLICGHAGDSRVVLCRDKKAIRLTEDHKPDRVDELARIEEAGGEVIFRGNCFRVSGDLAMSRSFGDLRLKEPLNLVICEPEIRIEELTPKDQFLILASDGLWDVLTDQKAVEIVRKCATPEEASKKLVETALQMGTMDNTTAIVVKLNWALDFLTQDEIDGKIQASGKKTKSKYGDTKPEKITIPQASKSDSFRMTKDHMTAHSAEDNKEHPAEGEISEELLSRTRSSSFSVRDGLEADLSGSFMRKSIFLPVSANAIKLKVLVPELSATKLMKFDPTTLVKEVIAMLMMKHRFTGNTPYSLYTKKDANSNVFDIFLDPEKSLGSCGLKDSDEIELRKTGSQAVAMASPTVDPSQSYSEALGADSKPVATKSSLPPPAHNNNNASQPLVAPVVTTTSSKSMEPVTAKTIQVKPYDPASTTTTTTTSTMDSPDQDRPRTATMGGKETCVFETNAKVFILENAEWKAQGPARTTVMEAETKQYRIVALNQESGTSFINTWIRKDRTCKKISDVFFSFGAVVNKVNITYGLSFATSEKCTEFSNLYLACVEKLKQDPGSGSFYGSSNTAISIPFKKTDEAHVTPQGSPRNSSPRVLIGRRPSEVGHGPSSSSPNSSQIHIKEEPQTTVSLSPEQRFML